VAKARACAAPMPRAPPLISAILPSSLPMAPQVTGARCLPVTLP
jgi:hypothetical protein